jgi:protein-S-isoprenylcysteine O-methyltransferase Ste14
MSIGGRQFAWRGAILAGFFVILSVARFRSDAPLLPGGLILVALAMALRLEAGRHIGPHSNGGRMEGGGLATTGPYVFSRHPLYLSNLAASAGLLVFANCLPPWGISALFLAAAGHHLSLARAEEAHLLAAHGDAYRSYLQATPRWLGFPRGGGGDATMAGRSDRASGAALAEAWQRQGANLAKTGASALCLWALASA